MGGAAGRGVGGGASAATEVAKPQTFDGTPSKVSGFIGACKLYVRMRLREALVEEQIQWILSYVQDGSADIWKENVMEELETGEIEFELAGEFLAEIRKEFGGGDEESVKVAELKKIEQGGRTMEEFMQDLKRVARGSGYKGCPLIEEFKWGMNRSIRRKQRTNHAQSSNGSRGQLPWIIIGERVGEKRKDYKEGRKLMGHRL